MVFRLKITPERISVYFKKASSDIKEEFASDEEAPINTMANEKASVKQDIVPDSSDNTTTEEVVIEQQLEPIVDEPKITSTTIEASNEDDISMEVETTEEEEVSETKANKLVEDFGEFDPKLLYKAKKEAKELGEQSIIDEIEKLDSCQRVVGSSLYCRFYEKNKIKF